MLWNNLSCEVKTAQLHSQFKNKFASLVGRSDSLICMCVYFKLVVNSLQNSLQHNYIVKLAILNTCYILNYSLKFCYFCEHHTAIAYAPPGNQLLLCVVSVVK